MCQTLSPFALLRLAITGIRYAGLKASMIPSARFKLLISSLLVSANSKKACSTFESMIPHALCTACLVMPSLRPISDWLSLRLLRSQMLDSRPVR